MSRSGVMLAFPVNFQIIEKKWGFPYIVQPKLNGLRCRAVKTENGYVLLSSEENIFVSVPHINQALDNKFKSLELDGELYEHGRPMSGPNGLLSIIKRKKDLHPEYRNIQYHIFDIVTDQIQLSRTKHIEKIHVTTPLIKVRSYFAQSLDGIARIYESICQRGYEGIIIREANAFYTPKKTRSMMKLKPNKEDYYEIVGHNEEISIENIPKDRLGSWVCKDNRGEIFSVGTGLNDEQREGYWTNPNSYIGKFCRIKFQELTYRGVPWLPVLLDVVDINPEINEHVV